MIRRAQLAAAPVESLKARPSSSFQDTQAKYIIPKPATRKINRTIHESVADVSMLVL